MNRHLFARPLARQTLGVFLLLTLLALSACGGSSSPTSEPDVVPTSTLVPTLAAIDTVAPPATPVPAATEAVTTTETTTTTETVTSTEPVTSTEATTTTEEVTPAEPVTATEETTATEVMTSTEETTSTEEMTSTAEMTSTTEPAATETVTATTEVSPSAEMTSTMEMSGSEAAANARVFFLQPTTNAVVPITFTVVMSYTGVNLEPAADAVEGAGHMHILVDSDFIEAGQAIPKDDLHYHYGDGSTTAELSLTPGSHVLRLQFADNNHIALEGDQYRDEIVVNVVDGAPDQAVRFVTPTAGATVPPTFTVTMAATGLIVEPAGVVREGAGHFHLLIDQPFVAEGDAIPSDDTHIHLGKAQLTTTVTLTPGTHLLRLQFADGLHRALAGDQYRAEAEVVVEEGAPDAQVMFVKPAGGAEVTSPFVVGWAANGLIIEAAGKDIRPDAGHLHVLVDQDFVPSGEVIPMDETHLHFGKGQTSTELTLEPGEHTLRLQMANGGHIALDGLQYQDEITVTVK